MLWPDVWRLPKSDAPVVDLGDGGNVNEKLGCPCFRLVLVVLLLVVLLLVYGLVGGVVDLGGGFKYFVYVHPEPWGGSTTN